MKKLSFMNTDQSQGHFIIRWPLFCYKKKYEDRGLNINTLGDMNNLFV